MYLKSLELHGFKSFPDKTVLKFNSGATVIVGPNGSGKSNITDAMRWVLGELSSKNIRGSKMEDVIFAGADDKKPMSFAEVSVTFDDSTKPKLLQSEYDEVTVTRRYYRSGDSEYFINRKKCRLKDIYQLFMNTGIGREGYSIIGQGKIAEIISKKSEERRGVFEESAGIAKYRYKKNESQKKLEETEQNMARVEDIVHELSVRVGPLEKESEKARKYLELYGEKKKVDVSLWIYDSDRMRLALNKTENDLKLSSHELEMAEDAIKSTSAQIERLYELSHANKEESRRNYEETSSTNKSMSEAQAENKVLLKEKAHIENMLTTETALSDTTKNTVEAEKKRLDEITDNLEKSKSEYKSKSEDYNILAKKLLNIGSEIKVSGDRLEELLKSQKEAEAAETYLQVRLNVLENNLAAQKKRSETIGGDIKKYEDEISSLDKEAERIEKTIDGYKTTIAGIDADIEIINKTTSLYAQEYNKYDGLNRKKQSEYDSLDSRINALVRMQEHFDGYNNSIKHVMNEAKAGHLRGIRGPLSQLIRVESRYITAIETTLGAALQNIVVDDEASAKASIQLLKSNNAGRATFYPLTTIRASERGRDYDGLERSAGFVGWADELVSCDYDYRNVVKSLLARVVVYDNIDNASIAAKSRGWKIRAVTLDGQQINSGGSFTGGAVKRDSGMLSRNATIDSLKAERQSVMTELSEIRKKLKEIEEKSASSNAKLKSAQDRRGLIEVLVTTENQSYSDIDGRRKALAELVDGMKADMASISESSRTGDDSLAEMKGKITAQVELIQKITDKRDDIAAAKGELELEADELEGRINELRIRIAELGKDCEAGENSLNETKERLAAAQLDEENRIRTISELNEKIAALESEAEEKQKEAERYSKIIEKLTEKQSELDSTGDKIESQINTLRQTEKEQTAKKDVVFMANSKNEAKLSSLKAEEQKLSAKMWEDYELTYASAVKFAEENDCHTITEGEKQPFQTQQNELRSKIKALGHVNVDSIDEYVEVKNRYEYIKNQLNDLRKSREDLLTIISGVEEDMKQIFTEAFVKINKYFGEVFRELFGGGHAEVILTDPENALESGIEINAAPPGKTIKNLNLLSGGEQAFIAIALLFALIKVNPSPFCIFDEIEAALDEVNVNRVGRYVKKYSQEMQIIMISHRRGTMEIADTLYGVTMQQSGVSKVLTLSTGGNHDDLLK